MQRDHEPVPAAAYVRMSTESQTYSLQHQQAALEAYAGRCGFEIVRTYADGAISGLTLRKRPGLQALLADVLTGSPGFRAILIYDVSRWGRFQDVDESAHYEFLCRQAGVRVDYCAEPFENDGTLVAALLKAMKRAMAAEKSRDLSQTITHAKRRMGLKGFWPGGNPGLGLRRAAVDAAGAVTLIFQPGERNGLKGRRIRVMPGPPDEVALVREAFRLFTGRRTTPNAVARALNIARPNGFQGRPWTQAQVRRLLSNELYVGARILGKAHVVLGECERRPACEWIAVAGALPAIVSAKTFAAAQRRLQRHRVFTDEALLDGLRAIVAKHGRLSHSLIARDRASASPSVYRKRFGSLLAAYQRVGYEPTPEQARLTGQIAAVRAAGLRPSPSPLSDDEVVERLRELRASAGMLSLELIEITPGLPRTRNLLRRFGSVARIYELAGHAPTRRQVERLGRRRRPAPSVEGAEAGPASSTP